MQDTPKDLDKKRTDEKLLVSEMIALYCRRQHKTPKGTLCPECRQLHDYALMRIDKCDGRLGRLILFRKRIEASQFIGMVDQVIRNHDHPFTSS